MQCGLLQNIMMIDRGISSAKHGGGMFSALFFLFGKPRNDCHFVFLIYIYLCIHAFVYFSSIVVVLGPRIRRASGWNTLEWRRVCTTWRRYCRRRESTRSPTGSRRKLPALVIFVDIYFSSAQSYHSGSESECYIVYIPVPNGDWRKYAP